MHSQDEGLKASDLGLLIFMMVAIWLWLVLS
jgi:hypothetical protein